MAKGCIISGAFSFVIGATIFSLMLYTLINEDQFQTNNKYSEDEKNGSSHHLQHAFVVRLDKTSIDLIVSLLLVFSLLTMISSILLVIGIKMNKPSLVLTYFSFGCLLCLLLLVGTVLELLHCVWYAAVATAAVAFIMVERLSAVYSFYENMEKGSDSNLLLQEDEFNCQVAIDGVDSN